MHEERDFHVVIIGGGVIGSAIACFTLQETSFRGRVTVIERDPSYANASSALSASSIRQQFGTAINVAISGYGIAFLREVGSVSPSTASDPRWVWSNPATSISPRPTTVPARCAATTAYSSHRAPTSRCSGRKRSGRAFPGSPSTM